MVDVSEKVEQDGTGRDCDVRVAYLHLPDVHLKLTQML